MFKMSTLKRVVGVATSVAVVLTPMSALGLANPTPDQHYTAPNSGGVGESVRAIVAASDGSYYVAGDFIDYSTSYGNAVLASTSSGTPISPFPDVDGSVNVTISDGVGGWYIAGNFNRVGPLERSNLAHINADGTADADFDADVNLNCGLCTAGDIKALALDEDDGILYVGGYFPSITFGATTVDGLVALDAADGSVLGSFGTPDISGADSSVYALALDEANNHLFAGGSFTTIDGFTRNNLAGFNASLLAVSTYNPNVDSDVLTLVLNPNNGYLYAGGIFSTVNGATTRNRVALFDPVGTVDGLFDPNADSTVNTLALDFTNGYLYAGGGFSSIGGQSRSRLGAVGMGDGVATSWDPVPNDYVVKIALSADTTTLYAVGGFTTVNGGSEDRAGIAAFTVTDGSALPFQQSLQELPVDIALSDVAASALIGVYNDSDEQYRADDHVFEQDPPLGEAVILHVLPDGTVDTNFTTTMTLDAPYVNGSVFAMALSPDENTLYVGGDFSCAGFFFGCSSSFSGLAAFDTSDGTIVTAFDPDPNTAVRALAISSDGATLYAGGDFGTIDDVTRNRLAAVNTSDGTATAFDPDVSGGGNSVRALELTADDSVLYIGGLFTALNSPPAFRNNLAAVTTVDGLATSFNPDVNDDVYALALSGDEGAVYAGGDFTTVNGGAEPRNYAAAFEPTSGVTIAFEPDADDRVLALAIGPDGIVYLGGEFDTIQGDDHEYIAAVDPDTGAPEAGFDANLEGANDAVYALAHGGTNNGLLAGGKFNQSFQDPDDTELPYVVTVNLAHYQDTATPTPTPAPPTPTPTPGGGGSSGGGGSFAPWLANPSPTPSVTPVPTPATVGDPLNLARYGLREGDTVSARNSADPDIYIVNAWGYKRLFLNPIIFNFYGHLGWAKVRSIVPPGRDSFPTSGLFRNCESNDQRVWAVEVTGEDTGLLHHVQVSGDVAVSQDPHFFRKVFCINNNEFNWYSKSPIPYTSLSQIPPYRR